MDGAKRAVKWLNFGWYLGFLGLLLISATKVADLLINDWGWLGKGAANPGRMWATVTTLTLVVIVLLVVVSTIVVWDTLSWPLKQTLARVLSAIALLTSGLSIVQANTVNNWTELLMIAAFAISVEATIRLLTFLKEQAASALAQAQSGFPDLQSLQSEIARIRQGIREENRTSGQGGEGREDQDSTDQRT